MKTQLTGPKMSNGICEVALKIINANNKDAKEPRVNIAGVILVISVSCAKRIQSVVNLFTMEDHKNGMCLQECVYAGTCGSVYKCIYDESRNSSLATCRLSSAGSLLEKGRAVSYFHMMPDCRQKKIK